MSEEKQEIQRQEPTEVISPQDRTWGMFCHLSAFAGLFVPFGNILGPLVIWLIKRNESSFVDANGKESLNFQISITIYSIVAGFLSIIFIGIPILIGLLIFEIIMIIIATLRANNGEVYHYPITIRFIK